MLCLALCTDGCSGWLGSAEQDWGKLWYIGVACAFRVCSDFQLQGFSVICQRAGKCLVQLLIGFLRSLDEGGDRRAFPPCVEHSVITQAPGDLCPALPIV